MVESKFNPLSLNNIYEIKKIKKRTVSQAFKEFKVGDTFLVSMDLGSSASSVSVWKITDDKLEFTGTCLWSVFSRISTESYELQSLKTGKKDIIKDYCENYCLTGEDPNVCGICPLKKYK